jgi:hypothetical protein
MSEMGKTLIVIMFTVGPDDVATGDRLFELDELYESTAGVVAHWKLAQETWQDLGPFLEWSSKAKVYTLHSGTVVQALR